LPSKGLLDLLVPVAEDIDKSVLAVRDSQIELFKEIERLSAGKSLLESSQMFFLVFTLNLAFFFD